MLWTDFLPLFWESFVFPFVVLGSVRKALWWLKMQSESGASCRGASCLIKLVVYYLGFRHGEIEKRLIEKKKTSTNETYIQNRANCAVRRQYLWTCWQDQIKWMYLDVI
jgi:hypothetical protein